MKSVIPSTITNYKELANYFLHGLDMLEELMIHEQISISLTKDIAKMIGNSALIKECDDKMAESIVNINEVKKTREQIQNASRKEDQSSPRHED